VPSSHPPVSDLLEALRAFLETEVMPAVSGELRFRCRVAVNVLATVTRELALGPAVDAAERARLVAILGHEAPLDDMRRELAERIRDGRIDAARGDVVEHLRLVLREALAINNPRWLSPRS
jgi:hypothetical protein